MMKSDVFLSHLKPQGELDLHHPVEEDRVFRPNREFERVATASILGDGPRHLKGTKSVSSRSYQNFLILEIHQSLIFSSEGFQLNRACEGGAWWVSDCLNYVKLEVVS
jgi:hypothetical protein